MRLSESEQLLLKARSPLKNYIIPGLTSWLISEPSANGCDRLFEMNREQLSGITPHSHRFDFMAKVVRGWVTNQIWIKSTKMEDDMYHRSELTYDGTPGKYHKSGSWTGKWIHIDNTYTPGQWYSMTYNQIHSIIFGKDSLVLFKEGNTITTKTSILEPFIDGHIIPTLKTENWMFRK
jgi:hypothetical protein